MRDDGIKGWCVEWCSAASGDAVNGLDIESVEYEKRFFYMYEFAIDYARKIARTSLVVMGEVGVIPATFARHGKLTPHWAVDEDAETEWIALKRMKQRNEPRR